MSVLTKYYIFNITLIIDNKLLIRFNFASYSFYIIKKHPLPHNQEYWIPSMN